MITWEQIGWTERAWGHQVYLYLVDKDTGEQFNEAPGFDHKPTDEEVKAAAEAIIARILQSRIDRAAEELNPPETIDSLKEKVRVLEAQKVELEAQVAALQEAKPIEKQPIGG